MTTGWTRRQVLTGAALAAAGCAAGYAGRNLSALASVTVGPNGREYGGDTLVALFLRGGADGLNVVVPHGDDDYYRLRPTLAIGRPKDASQPVAARALELNDFFGLHPALSGLVPFYKEGQMAVVHAVGSGDQTRSHFEAMATMERGLDKGTGAASGWLGRHLSVTAREVESPLRAVAIDETMPDSLRGTMNVTALRTLTDFRLVPPHSEPKEGNNHLHAKDHALRADALSETLRALYQGSGGTGDDAVARGGHETLAALDAVKRLDPANYKPANGAVYPNDILGSAFQQAACLVKGDVGVEVACIDMGGWDTHFGQGRDSGLQPTLLRILGDTLAAFARDMGKRMENTTLLVMTEFGRRAYENYSLGTDHGRASMMFLLGGGVAGGKVYADWPGLKKTQLEDEGDLRVTTDYRDILAEVVSRRLKNPKLAEVFPGYTPHFRNVVRG
jgi:uncharacterized protein (DUF1501 family)